MFLNFLDQGKKPYFLELAHYVVNIDGEYSHQELVLMDTYREEMRLSEEDYALRGLEMEVILQQLDKCADSEKRMMFLELIALVESDDKYESSEEKFIRTLMNRWEISEEKFQETQNWVKDMRNLYQRANEIIGA